MNAVCRIHKISTVPDDRLRYAVVAAQHEGKWVFCRQKERDTWELPGGHREPGENILDTARRELYEETGAEEFELLPICAYSVTLDGQMQYGLLYRADIQRNGVLPEQSEMAEVIYTDVLPGNWTYPDIQPFLFLRARIQTDLVIRPATQQDAAAICQLNRESLGYTYTEAQTAYQLSALLVHSDHKILIAELNGKVLGYIHGCNYDSLYNRPLKNLVGVAVGSAYRRMGIGTRLLDALEEWGQKTGAAGIRLASGSQRTAAHMFYMQRGYTDQKEQMRFIKLF